MKPQTIIEEMLLFTDTSFAKRELCEKDDPACNAAKYSVGDQLEKACWSGLLFDMFPDMFTNNDRKNLCVWKVNQGEQFVHVELGTTASSPEYVTSIDPYFFMPFVVYRN